MKKPMPLPETLNDFMLLSQMGYQVEFKNYKPVKVIKARSIRSIITKVDNALRKARWYLLVTRYNVRKALLNIGQAKVKSI